MKKIILTGILAGVAILISALILNFIFGWIFPSFQSIYTDTNIFLAMNSGRGLLFWAYPFALGIGLAWLYTMLKVKNTLTFAGIYFMVAAFPAFFINAGSFNLPVMMVVTWTIMSYLNGLVAGFIFSKMLR